ncbi:MAG: tetratricopeptide repeat protein [Bradymonadia bacterium]
MKKFLCVLISLLLICPVNAAPIKQYNVDQATNLFKQGEFQAALQHFQTLLTKTNNRRQKIRLQWNVARCFEELGRYEEALKEFYGYKSIVSDKRRNARAEKKIRSLIPKVFGSLNVKCSQPTAFNVFHEPSSAPGTTENFGPLDCPTTLRELRAGRATVKGTNKEHPVKETVLVIPGKEAQVYLESEPPGVSSRTMWIAGGVVGTALLVSGIYLLSNRSDDSGSSAELCFDCPFIPGE